MSEAEVLSASAALALEQDAILAKEYFARILDVFDRTDLSEILSRPEVYEILIPFFSGVAITDEGFAVQTVEGNFPQQVIDFIRELCRIRMCAEESNRVQNGLSTSSPVAGKDRSPRSQKFGVSPNLIASMLHDYPNPVLHVMAAAHLIVLMESEDTTPMQKRRAAELALQISPLIQAYEYPRHLHILLVDAAFAVLDPRGNCTAAERSGPRLSIQEFDDWAERQNVAIATRLGIDPSTVLVYGREKGFFAGMCKRIEGVTLNGGEDFEQRAITIILPEESAKLLLGGAISSGRERFDGFDNVMAQFGEGDEIAYRVQLRHNHYVHWLLRNPEYHVWTAIYRFADGKLGEVRVVFGVEQDQVNAWSHPEFKLDVEGLPRVQAPETSYYVGRWAQWLWCISAGRDPYDPKGAQKLRDVLDLLSDRELFVYIQSANATHTISVFRGESLEETLTNFSRAIVPGLTELIAGYEISRVEWGEDGTPREVNYRCMRSGDHFILQRQNAVGAWEELTEQGFALEHLDRVTALEVIDGEVSRFMTTNDVLQELALAYRQQRPFESMTARIRRRFPLITPAQLQHWGNRLWMINYMISIAREDRRTVLLADAERQYRELRRDLHRMAVRVEVLEGKAGRIPRRVLQMVKTSIASGDDNILQIIGLVVEGGGQVVTGLFPLGLGISIVECQEWLENFGKFKSAGVAAVTALMKEIALREFHIQDSMKLRDLQQFVGFYKEASRMGHHDIANAMRTAAIAAFIGHTFNSTDPRKKLLEEAGLLSMIRKRTAWY